MSQDSLRSLSNAELLAEVKSAAVTERRSTAALIALLAELDERRLFLGEGCASLFVYCTQVLRLSEHAAYGRIAAARASHRWPDILDLLASGAITLTTVVLLAPHLTPENHEALLDGARHKTKVEVERLIACLYPQPDIESRVRRAPQSGSAELRVAESPTAAMFSEATAPAARPTVAPLAPDRYLIKATVSLEAYANLKRAQDLLRHVIPTGDPAAIIERALVTLVNELERTKLAQVKNPRVAKVAAGETSRHISAAVKRAVWCRDSGRCAFVGTEGRCTETGFLEFHHVQPYADGGSTTIENLSLRCRAHNAHEATEHFGQRQLGLDRVECG